MFSAYIPTRLELEALMSKFFPVTVTPEAATTVIGLSIVLLLRTIVNKIYAHLSAPMRDLPGPKSVSLLTGSIARGVWEADDQASQLEWTRQYGPVFRYRSLFMMSRVLTTDPQALNFIMNAPEFEKSKEGRAFLGSLLGNGLLVVEGSKHRQQRKIISPAFGLPQIKEYSQLFIEKANELRDVLMAQAVQSRTPDGSLKTDMYLWLNKVTLDIIGHTGFNHAFASLHQDGPHEIAEGFRKATIVDPFSIVFLMTALMPPTRLLPTERSRAIATTSQFLRSIGENMISQKKAEILAVTESDANSGVEKKNLHGRDLVSVLIRANMARDIPDNARMSDEEILAQVPTFLLAGHETTSTAVVWALYALACNRAAYAKLTVEARGYYTDSPSMEELNGMTYLDYVIREVLRLHPPVTNTDRVAKEDVVVPLSEPFTDRHGVERHEFRLRKGDVVIVPILAVHRRKSLWGEDADEFKPERWEAIPEAAKAIPGVFSNLLTFITGTHACVGYRFSLIEMKAILFSFIRAFDFELAVPPSSVVRKTMIVARPFLASEPDSGPQLPLVIRPAKTE
ncbi:cytochrome P450 [Russula dissimulans]|nr:cytochrome P450 [Russula dissimulans]